MVSPEIVDEEGERLLNEYFDINIIIDSENPSREFLKQIKKLNGFGIIEQLRTKYTMTNKLFKKLGIGPLKRKEFKRAKIGKPKSNKKQILRKITEKTGKREIISKRKDIIRSFEKWKNNKIKETFRDKKGRFTKSFIKKKQKQKKKR